MFYKKLALAVQKLYRLQVVANDSKTGIVHWSYDEETGPHQWHCLTSEFEVCGNGKRQTPIDITTSIKADLPPLKFDYRPIPLVIENNGHTIQVTADTGGVLKVGENSYQLLQFHSHTPSENAINGKRFDMVIHFVHQNIHGQLAVVSTLLEVGSTTNSAIDTLWKFMPQTPGEPQQHDIQIDINQLLPKEREYFTFEGSLTTPPCTEGVKWILLKQPLSISAAQLAQYRALYPENARPLQPLNGREILSSN